MEPAHETIRLYVLPAAGCRIVGEPIPIGTAGRYPDLMAGSYRIGLPIWPEYAPRWALVFWGVYYGETLGVRPTK